MAEAVTMLVMFTFGFLMGIYLPLCVGFLMFLHFRNNPRRAHDLFPLDKADKAHEETV